MIVGGVVVVILYGKIPGMFFFVLFFAFLFLTCLGVVLRHHVIFGRSCSNEPPFPPPTIHPSTYLFKPYLAVYFAKRWPYPQESKGFLLEGRPLDRDGASDGGGGGR